MSGEAVAKRGPAYGRLLGVTIAVALVALVIAFGIRGMAIVEGRSMEPLFHTGDVVFLEHKGPGEIGVGNIIVYKSGSNSYIIHRVISVYQAGGTTCYVVKGDNNPVPDPGLAPCPYLAGERGVPYEAVTGVVFAPHGVPVKVPYLGGLTLLFRG